MKRQSQHRAPGDLDGYAIAQSDHPQGQADSCRECAQGPRRRDHEAHQRIRRLPRFLERYEGVSVIFRSTMQKAELRSENVDIAISSGPTHPPGSSRFVTLARWLCASPVYLERRGAVQTLDDLGMHDIIATNDRETHFAPGLGNLFELEVFKDLRTRLNIDSLAGARHLSVQGAGIVCLPEQMCRDQVRRGELVRLLPDLEIRALDLNVFYPSKRSAAPVVRAFTELLRASLSTASVSSSALEMPVPSNVDATDAPGIASAVPQPLSSPHEEPRSA
ncbi:LysR substrate-binding domain-containing protein [Variovorax sp. W1I1]|uniref:LysR substrate-binding domain-containing protein n=1 Tax=Variovorax sp. W1I1 TaxID=3042309 RepID=UPI0027D81324|nr:LysR substrate-binding domain-containing protein [Variovorax sp. W1I1]